MAYVVLDLETTGLDSQKDTIIEVGALRFAEPRALQHTGPCEELQLLVNPGRTLDPAITDLTGIQDSDLAGQAPWEEVRPRVQTFLSAPATYFVAHNVEFERSFLEQHNVDLSRLTLLDTYDLAFMVLPQVFQLNLRSLCIRVGIGPVAAPRVYADALATARVFALLLSQVESLPDEFLQQLLAHSPCEDWGFRDVWSAIAAQRNLAELGRNKPMVWPLPVDSGNPGHPDASPAPGSRLENAQEILLSLAQPSLYQALEVEQRNADPTFPCKGAESMAQVLAAGIRRFCSSTRTRGEGKRWRLQHINGPWPMTGGLSSACRTAKTTGDRIRLCRPWPRQQGTGPPLYPTRAVVWLGSGSMYGKRDGLWTPGKRDCWARSCIGPVLHQRRCRSAFSCVTTWTIS